MSERYSSDEFDSEMREVAASFRPLPWWLANRMLRDGEKVEWVYGPRFNPPWERYVTHPALILVALPIVAFVCGMATLGNIPAQALGLLSVMATVALVVMAIIVLGISNGYFTRLVVTDQRLFIAQGYEAYRSWGLDDLPPALIRYGGRGNGLGDRTIDLNAVKNMLGTKSDQFVEAKTILMFSKQLGQIQKRERGRPES